MKEITTKMKIFNISLDLFSEFGYNEVTIRKIASNVGIKESSIYNHYSNKEAILDDIFDYFISNMKETEISNDEFSYLLKKDPSKLYNIGSENIKKQFMKVKMQKILRLIFIEMFRNEKIKKFFKCEIMDEPIEFWTLFYKTLIDEKVLIDTDPRQLAKYYYEYGLFKMYKVAIIDYPKENDFEEVFNDIENYFIFLLNANLRQD
ncbi:TetR/AcrR family transcriptional regulator [Methanobrevibacter sp. DSM 116169]|uniref:TetR/AcrR family transcriptional regulator n=1 Tax=Methanobrevibacter sp. DSM 116169 TaxID=3242727 RepID=UPI0038FCE3F6